MAGSLKTSILDNFFYPQKIALIGASAEPGKVGNDILRNLIEGGFEGEVFPVNPKRDEILGIKVYHSIEEIPSDIDLSIFVVPPKIVLSGLGDVAKKNNKAVIVISAGFKEVGAEGAKLEQELIRKAKEYGMEVLGPNCLGIISPPSKVNASFAAEMPLSGNISFISQSGALLAAVLDWSMDEGIGFAKIISLGNKAVLDETDFLEYLAEDPETEVILGYIEGVKDGQRFIKVAQQVTRKKPVLLIKAGSTSAGARAASSHTGTLAGSDKAFDTAFRQTGIIRIHNVADLFDLAKGFAHRKIPRGNKLAVITNAGGPGILSADASEKNGIQLPPPKTEIIEELKQVLPPTAALFNPIDIIGDAKEDRYRNALNVLKKDRNFDGFLVILTPQSMTDPYKVAEEVVKFSSKCKRPIFTAFMGGPLIKKGKDILVSNNIPNFSFPDEAVKSFAALVKYQEFLKKPEPTYKVFNDVDKEKVRSIIRDAYSKGMYNLSEVMAKEIFKAYGFDFPESHLARSIEEAVEIAEKLKFPLVMKISSPDILHKSDIGGVKVNLKNLEDVVKAFMEITTNVRRKSPKATILGVDIQEMVTQGKEIILGMTRDPSFGPLIMFGLGGIYVEVLKDVSFRIAPIPVEEVPAMVQEIRSYPLLTGVRGEKSIDFNALYEMILRLSQLVTDFPEVVELDLNPVKLLPKGEKSYALDARITLLAN